MGQLPGRLLLEQLLLVPCLDLPELSQLFRDHVVQLDRLQNQ